MASYSSGGISSAMISSPRPVGTIMNRYQAVAPRDLTSWWIFGASSWLRLVNELLTRKSMLCALNRRAAFMTPSKAPG